MAEKKLKAGKVATGGNRSCDQAWIEEVRAELHEPDEAYRPEGFDYKVTLQWDGDMEEVNPDFFKGFGRLSRSGEKCTGISFIRDETGMYIVDANWNRLIRPCLAVPIRGGKVCQTHGGRLVQVKAAAEAVLQNAAEIVALRLVGLTKSEDDQNVFIDHKVRLGAANSVLDRVGIKGGASEIEVTLPGYKKVLDALFTDDSAEPDGE
jgi:hypothetical protein